MSKHKTAPSTKPNRKWSHEQECVLAGACAHNTKHAHVGTHSCVIMGKEKCVCVCVCVCVIHQKSTKRKDGRQMSCLLRRWLGYEWKHSDASFRF